MCVCGRFISFQNLNPPISAWWSYKIAKMLQKLKNFSKTQDTIFHVHRVLCCVVLVWAIIIIKVGRGTHHCYSLQLLLFPLNAIPCKFSFVSYSWSVFYPIILRNSEISFSFLLLHKANFYSVCVGEERVAFTSNGHNNKIEKKRKKNFFFMLHVR